MIEHENPLPDAIAIVGMAGRFPGAPDLDAYWSLIARGRVAIRQFDDEQLRAAGIPAREFEQPGYVKARGILEDIAGFDAGLFGMSPREAAWTDPQHRLFLESAYAALEDAACDPQRTSARIGVFGGVSTSSYFLRNIYSTLGDTLDPDALDRLRQGSLGSDKDFFTTRVSYRLDLRGPSVDVQTACSTSLAAVHLAAQSLLAYSCDIALAGGASVYVPHVAGYLYQPGGVVSPTGHCRPFDADAAGTVPGSGVGVVVLRRLEDALAHGDPIRAIIRGSAMNNDGAVKMGYGAPGLEGQADMLAEALAMADVPPETIGYIEAHGTGTRLGDPVEVAALRRVFGARPAHLPPCRLGAIKASIGHLDAAAGIAGLIKTVLMLEHAQIGPQANFDRLNPEIDFGASFEVSRSAIPWPDLGSPPRAGVSSLGIGGTNVHAVLEAAPGARAPESSRAIPQLLVLSARTDRALAAQAKRLASALEHDEPVALEAVAHTLGAGRRPLERRASWTVESVTEAIAALREGEGIGSGRPVNDAGVILVFPELGFDDARAFVHGWAERHEPIRADLDAAGLTGSLDATSTTAMAGAVFTVQVAVGRMWRSLGVVPMGLRGTGLGLLSAACVAEAITCEDALALASVWGHASDVLARAQVSRWGACQVPVIGARGAIDASSSAATWGRALLDEAPSEATGAATHAAARKIHVGGSGADPVGAFLGAAGELWCAGAAMDWTSLPGRSQSTRVSLPAYPFERTPHWVDPPQPRTGSGSKRELSRWFSVPSWVMRPATVPSASPHGPWLVLAEDRELGARVADTATAAGVECTVAADLTTSPRHAPSPSAILMVLDAARERGPSPRDLYEVVEHELAAAVSVARTFAPPPGERTLDLLVVTQHLASVAPGDEVDPSRSLVLGAIRVIGQEFPRVRTRCLDIDDLRRPDGPSRIVDEVLDPDDARVVALRGPLRFVEQDVELPLEPSGDPLSAGERSGPVVLLGGMGRVGLAMARWFGQQRRIPVAIVGRSPLPPRDRWSALAPNSKRIAQLCQLEQAGVDFEVYSADAREGDALDATFAAIETRMGAIRGVVHAVNEGGYTPLHEATAQSLYDALATKVRAAIALDVALRDRRPDFVVLCSSLASRLGGIGTAAYCAGNAFLDAWALARRGPVRAVLWDMWASHDDGPDHAVLVDALAPAQAMEALERTLAQPHLHAVMVSRVDVAARREAFADRLKPRDSARDPRPELGIDFVGPRNPIEEGLAEIWSEVLGLSPVGIHDPFFELGGDSLSATMLMAQVRDRFGIEVPLARFFEVPTVAEAAEALATELEQGADDGELDALLAEVEALSDDDAKRQLRGSDA
ncbi:MAG: beta-ketoacyl synthase N-terminal-like domain-containing protein [Myxococcota bacterium]